MNLSGDQIKNSYGALLNIGASGATGTLQPVTDGFGNILPFEVSTTTFNFTGAVTGGPIGPTGAAGSSGTSGTSGVSGSSGTSGVNGANGSSGTSGADGTSGTSGAAGSSGTSGTSGVSGSSGTSGVNGSSGTSGTSGVSGSSGTSGANGSSGTSGTSGVSGSSGTSGINGTSGTSGINGATGPQGEAGFSNAFFNYQAKTTITSGDPGSGHIIWNNATQASATSLNVSDEDQGGNNVDIFFANLTSGSTITIQDQASHLNYQTWTIGTPVDNTTYWTLPVTLVTSTHSFSNNDQILFIVVATPSGSSGTSGTSGVNGTSGTSGANGTSGTSGVSGSSGTSGVSGSSGTSGVNGATGAVGPTGAAAPGGGSPITIEQTDSLVSTGVGATATAGGSIVIGATACSTAGTSIVIGLNAFNNQPDMIVIGNGARQSNGNSAAGINIGSATCSTNSGILIGPGSCNDGAGGVTIGYSANGFGSTSTAIGQGAEVTPNSDISTAIGGFGAKVCNSSQCGIAISGCISTVCSTGGIAIGNSSLVAGSSADSIVIGNFACSTHACAVALGYGIITERTATTHVQSLVAYGQGASKLNSIASGATGLTIDWNDGNNQKIDLTSSITGLTLSNPIDGANYMLEIVQGGVGSYTITWPATVKWAFNNPPVLTTTVGGTDVINLFYDGTNYLGTFALNFV